MVLHHAARRFAERICAFIALGAAALALAAVPARSADPIKVGLVPSLKRQAEQLQSRAKVIGIELGHLRPQSVGQP